MYNKYMKMSQFFPKPYERFRGNIKDKLDLSNYVPKTDLKGATGANTSNLASKSKLAKLKPKIDKMDIDKLKSVSVDLSKLTFKATIKNIRCCS